MSDEATFFDLPNSPENFGVVLPPSNLRRIDYSGLDYDTSRRAIIEYIRTYFPDDFNDFIASNGIIMIMEIVSSVVAKMSLREDLIANESFLPTATTEEAVKNHLALINQKINRQTPAVVDIECSVDFPTFTDIRIPAGTRFVINNGEFGDITYELYRAPNDWSNDIIIPANKRGVVAWGIEGFYNAPIVQTSSGGPNQIYEFVEDNILERPLLVQNRIGTSLINYIVIEDPIELYGPNDPVVAVDFTGNKITFKFGDDINGKSPPSGSEVIIRYRVGGGVRGRIGSGQIDTSRQFVPDPPANVATSIKFRNLTPSVGGTDKEKIADAKKRAPKQFALQRSIVTASDYAQAAQNFSHPAYGSIIKAVATLRSSINANLVEIYALALGSDNIPAAPSAGLKSGLKTYFENLNVLTDSVEILDGKLYPVDLELNVIIDRNADASIIKTRVESVIDEYFNITNWDLGEPFYVSNFIEAIETIDGISYIDLFQPVNNILPTYKLSEESESNGIAIDQVITLGNRKTSYYYNRIN